MFDFETVKYFFHYLQTKVETDKSNLSNQVSRLENEKSSLFNQVSELGDKIGSLDDDISGFKSKIVSTFIQKIFLVLKLIFVNCHLFADTIRN